MGGLAAVLVVLLLITPAVFAAQFTVDWSLGVPFSSWTTKPLNEGDILVFIYDATHTVDIVSASDYANCDSSNALLSKSSSPTSITLRAGTTFIICGTPGHCAAGMKLQVTAKAASPTVPSSPPPVTKPPPSPHMSPPTVNSTKPSPPPHKSHPIAPSPLTTAGRPRSSHVKTAAPSPSPILAPESGITAAPPKGNGAAASLYTTTGSFHFGLGFGLLVAIFV